MTYFTVDLHLGHENTIRFCARPFSSHEEMDAALIDNWNSRVTAKDDVYILGDMFYRTVDVADVLSCLSGRKHLIVGNHDHTWMRRVQLDKYFTEVRDLIVLKEGGRVMTLCHYPMLSWPHMFHGSYCIFGHIHNDKSGQGWAVIKDNPLCSMLVLM